MAAADKYDGRTATHSSESNPLLRSFLLSEVLSFVNLARSCPGVIRIALIGSLTTSKPQPKDADVLVSVADDADLTMLAKAGRSLKEKAKAKTPAPTSFSPIPRASILVGYATGVSAGLSFGSPAMQSIAVNASFFMTTVTPSLSQRS